MLDRIHLREIDWVLIGLLMVNSAIGLVLIQGASYFLHGGFVVKQAVWILVSLLFLLLLLTVDYKILMDLAPYAYAVFLMALLVILVLGKAERGHKSWIGLAFMGGQPSELAKIVVILMLARVFSGFKSMYVTAPATLVSGAVTAGPLLLVAVQPDLGTAMSILFLWLGGLALAGMNRRTLVIILIAAVVLSFFSWQFLLKDYQKTRLKTIIDPLHDPRGSGYHVLQSKIAIGSGGVVGKGFMKGSQSQLRFLPARHTDFIFSVLGEEFGFLGVCVVLGSYFLLLARIFRAVGQTRDRAGLFIVFLCGCMVTFPFMVNVLMIIGLFPVTGVPIPLLSYGGSSLLSTYLAVGLVANVKLRRFAYA
ncbi:MAG: rod shape-determining protein RodA [Candidatus Aminicenantales bacterium]|jgi:rod shape determining protein RodA